MPYQSKGDLDTAIQTDLADNFSQAITAADVRDIIQDMNDSVLNSARATTLTDAGTINWDIDNGQVSFVTLGGDRTLAEPTNHRQGQLLSINVAQDGTGTRLLTWDSFFVFPADTPPTLSTAVNRVDCFTFLVIYDGTNNVAIQQSVTLAVFRSGWTPELL